MANFVGITSNNIYIERHNCVYYLQYIVLSNLDNIASDLIYSQLIFLSAVKENL